MSERDMLADLCGGRRGVRHMPQVRGDGVGCRSRSNGAALVERSLPRCPANGLSQSERGISSESERHNRCGRQDQPNPQQHQKVLTRRRRVR